MALIADRLAEAGYVLPETPSALGSYVPAVRTGGLVYTAGQLPLVEGRLLTSGLVGAEVPQEVGVRCAAQAALNALAAAATACDLEDVVRVVRLTGYVACPPGFTAQPAVVDGASAVILAAFGEAGRHTRVAVGVTSLPLGAPVEVEVVLEIA